jgi:hypothetical protein
MIDEYGYDTLCETDVCSSFSHSQEVLVTDRNASRESSSSNCQTGGARPACPVCGGELMEIKHKLQCSRCRTICETCCEGGRG